MNVDGGDSWAIGYLSELLNRGEISKLILISGNNRGVGRSFQNCLGVAEGDYIFKIDTDLVFKPNWLSKALLVLDNNPEVGAVSLFDYNYYDPNDDRFKPETCRLEERPDCYIVKDFVSSIYGFRKEDAYGWFPHAMPDDGFHTKLQEQKGKLAITKENLVTNNGFGVYKSVYVSGTEENPYKTPTYDEPLIFQKGRS